MKFQLDQLIFQKIDRIIGTAGLSAEMEQMIRNSLNADCPTGELFKWAYLTCMSCECAGGEPEEALPGAIAMEFFALAADILDDIQDRDNDDMPWRRIPEANAINLATCLLMLSFTAIAEIKDDGIYRKLCTALQRTGTAASNGQFREFLYAGETQVPLEQYFELAGQKAGSLTACACKLGAVSAGASEETVTLLADFGRNFGIMNQIRNDLKDFLNFETKKDFINNKKTLPYVYLLHVLKNKENAEFNKLILEKNFTKKFGEKEKDRLRQITAEEGVAQYCAVMFDLYRKEAGENLKKILVPEKMKEKMKELVGDVL
jgi:competence protein ComQ